MNRRLSLGVLMVFAWLLGHTQPNTMLQTFYWDVPVDATNKKGLWWSNLEQKAADFKRLGIHSLWLPAPSKGNWGIYDMGYGVYDHYDLGNYDQKGTVETRFGSRSELEGLIAVMQDTTNGSHPIAVYADIILNHMYASDENAEHNPEVKQYVFDEAFRDGEQRMPYPTNEILWVIPQARKGRYHITIKGYHLDHTVADCEWAYEWFVDYNKSGYQGQYTEVQPRQKNALSFPGSGHTIRARLLNRNDEHAYTINAPGGKDIMMRLTARRVCDGKWEWTDQTLAYYPVRVRRGRRDITHSQLEARTTTSFFYPPRNCDSQPHYTWNYEHFNPSGPGAWLEGWGEGDEIMPKTKAYGHDLNTHHPEVQHRMNEWGRWMAETIQFDGFRLDFVRGFPVDYAAGWVKHLPLKDGQQRFVVGEYWGGAPAIHRWLKEMDTLGAQVAVFDFPLKETLTAMCNGDSDFDMRQLTQAGLLRNDQGYALDPSRVVTFLENHDTGKEHDKWVTRDWHLGYAYLLTHPGIPCLFYPHLYGVTLRDMQHQHMEVLIPDTLRQTLEGLLDLRNHFLDGGLAILPVSEGVDARVMKNLYVARRQGNGLRDGALLVLNNRDEPLVQWVDVNVEGWNDWSETELVDFFNPGQEAVVGPNGQVLVEAPARGFAIYVKKQDWQAFFLP